MQDNKDNSNYDQHHVAVAASFTPSNDELWKLLQDTNNRVSILEHRASFTATAFPKNDLGKPDYDGHRKEHLQIRKDSEVVESYQVSTTKSVLSYLAIGAIGIFVLGAIDWIRAHLK